MDGFIGKGHFSEVSNQRHPSFRQKVIRVDQCRGCGSCMLACSFHHKKVFSPACSSISVSRNNQNGIVRWSIDSTCDDCFDEKEPMCQKYCAYDVLTIPGSIR